MRTIILYRGIEFEKEELVAASKYFICTNRRPDIKKGDLVIYEQLLCGEYYWQNYIDDLPEKPDEKEVPRPFLQEVINRVGNKSNFYTIDVGQTLQGDWIVIELNEGQQSGLSCNDPEKLYFNLHNSLQ